jgi:sigma-54 specific flagellar transcriptional regulator A
MAEVRGVVRQVAPTSASVLITGPSGSGKEMVARAIHVESRRSSRPFVAVNCGAIPRDLLESELFGHEKGSFTGALTQRRGRFEDADGGTLFLDEIGDMPADMQVKLLRVLEERAITRVGGRGSIAVDTRIISATHRDIAVSIEEQRFREDLFYRLAVFPIALPSLAERAEDVPLLIEHFLARIADRKAAVKLSPLALDRLVAHHWPGNVRELRNVVERAAILHPGVTIGADEIELLLHRSPRVRAAEREALWSMTAQAEITLPKAAPEPLSLDQPVDLKSLVAELEHRYIVGALRSSKGVVADAARMLSLQRTTLIEKMNKYGIERVTV